MNALIDTAFERILWVWGNKIWNQRQYLLKIKLKKEKSWIYVEINKPKAMDEQCQQSDEVVHWSDKAESFWGNPRFDSQWK